eukprot:CAMPEP_0183713100 /NCGR_PEP_ID=MMETSP0737-20130205/8066_1 /TAXON_ID=385413 /ORGANISM="Thalassiosira miniscula, Strain CCMP1093" /LENGTH=369 /DNA_ID=CAMNT_0025941849 /DNA_START=214 /DNA_END=1320 /DNA_ORIENTATION=-
MSVVLELVSTGILMGIIHVLTGPDHLSALATLCGIQTHKLHRSEAFFLGIRWGVGHSFGLLIVGGLLIVLEQSSGEWIGMDPLLSTILESFVGVFMLLLGVYGLFKADDNWRMSALERGGHASLKSSSEVEIAEGSDIISQMEDALENDSREPLDDSIYDYGRAGALDASESGSQYGLESVVNPSDVSFVSVPMVSVTSSSHGGSGLQLVPQTSFGTAASSHSSKGGKAPSGVGGSLMRATSLMKDHTSPDHSAILAARRGSVGYFFLLDHSHSCCGRFFTPGGLAVTAGILHGVAGPGGVLGVIPAVQLRNAKLAIIYLGTFCLTSTCVMGGFAAFYGSFSEWLAGKNRVYLVEAGSAFLSLAVGFIW